ncbi:sugar phosphate isomerase/epimerase [Geomonas sp. Red69]|uniref:sugar phosphate isomerase/epimerase family protein n=1 Tax=Geomonas diazotrophica TaxID=2843197 RepID=UPI001C0F81C4|nr:MULTISPECIES: sugar phosphate isomerase/epimerase family protein [Geomonas]MBU5638087.1 sugar phosphate isomerase/epimerase [Geomonas diazotrophica]QXE86260.1 sugar phosphate isomerase/epimerase [Geomonas nitrogeniifigens]
MSKRVFVHVPYPQIGAHLPFILERRLSPEIYLSADALDAAAPAQLAETAQVLAGEGLSCTIHAPFMDLNPGSLERMLRDATMHRFRQVLDAAELLRPEVMVFHPGFDRWRYGEAQGQWLELSVAAWREVLQRTKEIGTVVAVENIFEEEPSTLKALFEAVQEPSFGHCFDVGHWNLFKRVGMEKWFEALGTWIKEVHIHDNGGTKDDHAPPGEGAIDFELFFRLMERYAPDAAYTIESHSRAHLESSLQVLTPYLG